MPKRIEIFVYDGDELVAEAEADDAGGALLAVRTLWDEARRNVQGQKVVARVYADGRLAREYDRRP